MDDGNGGYGVDIDLMGIYEIDGMNGDKTNLCEAMRGEGGDQPQQME